MQRRFRRVYAKKTPPETFQTTAVFRAKNGRTKKQAHCSRRSARKKSTSQVELVLKCFTSLRRERALTAILLTCNPENRNSPRPFPTFSQRLPPCNGYLSVTQRMAALERPLAHSSGRVDWLPFLFHHGLPVRTTRDYTSRMKLFNCSYKSYCGTLLFPRETARGRLAYCRFSTLLYSA